LATEGVFLVKPTLLLTFALLGAMAMPAAATTGKIFREPDGAVTIYDLTPNASVKFGVDAAPSRRLTTDACGSLAVSATSSYPIAPVQVNGTIIDPANLSTRIRPPCRRQENGSYALDEERTGPYLNSENGAVIVPNLTANTRYEITYPGLYRLLSRKVNACGFLRVRETSSVNFNDFLLLPTATGSTLAEFRISDIPVLNGLLCHRSHLYYPSDWAGWPTLQAIPGSEISESAIASSGVASSPSGSLASGAGFGGSGSGTTGSGGSDGGTTDDGTTGDGSSGGTTGDGTTGDGTTGDGSSGGTAPDPAMYDFTEATYNASLHDYNGDGLVDDNTGDGIPDDQDGDGFPDGPWGPNDFPRSAGPGFTIPVNASMCYGYNGNLVVQSWSFTRNTAYWLTGDDGLWPASSDDPLEGIANAGPTSDAPMIRFPGDFRASNYNHSFEGSKRGGYVMDYRDRFIVDFYFPDVQSCLIPPWFNP
jgi:hypothetical protein